MKWLTLSLLISVSIASFCSVGEYKYSLSQMYDECNPATNTTIYVESNVRVISDGMYTIKNIANIKVGDFVESFDKQYTQVMSVKNTTIQPRIFTNALNTFYVNYGYDHYFVFTDNLPYSEIIVKDTKLDGCQDKNQIYSYYSMFMIINSTFVDATLYNQSFSICVLFPCNPPSYCYDYKCKGVQQTCTCNGYTYADVYDINTNIEGYYNDYSYYYPKYGYTSDVVDYINYNNIRYILGSSQWSNIIYMEISPCYAIDIVTANGYITVNNLLFLN